MKTKPYIHKVLYRDCDMMGVVNNAVYVHLMEDARVDALSQLGLEYKGMEANGFAGPVLSLSVDYKNSARFGDEIEITVSFDRYTGARLFLSYTISEKGTGKLYATAKSEHCFIDLKTGAPVLIRSYFPEWNDTLINACKANAE